MITDCKQMRKLLFFLAVTSNMQSFKLSNNSTRTCHESSSKNFFGHIKRLTKTGDFEKMLALVFQVKGKYLDQIFKLFTPNTSFNIQKRFKFTPTFKFITYAFTQYTERISDA